MNMWLEWALSASFLILAVLLIRAAAGRRVAAGVRYALWGVVLLRLLVPMQLFTAPIPLRTVSEPAGAVTEQTGTRPQVPPAAQSAPVWRDETPAQTVTLSPAVPPEPADRPAAEAPAGPAADGAVVRSALGWLWLGGAVAAALVLLLSNLRFGLDLRRRRLPLAADCPLPVYTVEGLPSPCLFGLVRPAVYVTPETAKDPAMLRHVLAHETAHARHLDHIWSALRCLALTIHWWNPLVWLAVCLSRRDGELACDEAALRRLGDGERGGYGRTLLTIVTARPDPADLFSAATTMSSGKRALWERVRCIARPGKRLVWAAVLAVVLAVAVAACAFSSAAAPGEGAGEDPNPTVSAAPEDAAATARINGGTVTLIMDYQGGNPDGEVGGAVFTVVCGENQARFTDDWVEETPITLAGVDLDGDGTEEVVLAYTTSHLTGGLLQSLRVFDGDTLNERAAFTRDDLPGVIFEQVKLTGRGDYYALTAPGVAETIAKAEWDEESYPAETDLMNMMVFGNYYGFAVADGRLYCDLGIWQGQCGNVRVELGLEDGGLVCRSFRYVPAAADMGDLTAVRTDLNLNGVPETLEVAEVADGKQLRVMENGYCIWSEDGLYAHGGWNTLFLCRIDGQDWLLRYNPNMSTGSADHSYTLFNLTGGWQQVKDGAAASKVMVRQTGAMEFDTNFTQAWYRPMDADAAARFLEELSPLLEDARLLLNTNPELEALYGRTGRWLTYPWDQYAPAGFAYDGKKSLEDNLRAWEEAGDMPAAPTPAVQVMPYTGSLNLTFCSGAGGWSTDLVLNADGTFTGEYSDSDMGVTGPGYALGTQYLCTFHGRFGAVEQVSGHAWSLTLEEIVLDTGHPVGEEWIANGVRYISSTPYGLSGAGEDAPPEPGAAFMLYAPGATPEEIGAGGEFWSWIHQEPGNITGWALRNMATDDGFLG